MASSRRPSAVPPSQITKLIADAAAMREHIATLEARIVRLEAQLAGPSASAAAPPPRPSKRSAPFGPPPLPKVGGKRSVVDISEIAELVESIPPPPLRPRK